MVTFLRALLIFFLIEKLIEKCFKKFCSQLVKLVPFMASATLFLTKYAHTSNKEAMFLLLKCLPLISLCVFVLANGALAKNNCYAKRILLGLFVSSIADFMIEKCTKFFFLFIFF